MKCTVGPCQSERVQTSKFCAIHGPNPDFARDAKHPVEHPNFGILGYLELDEPVTEATIDAFWAAWPPDDESFEAFAGNEPNLLGFQFCVDLDDDIGNPTNTGKAFAEAHQAVLRVTAEVGLACHVRPLRGSEFDRDWFELQ